MEDVEQEREGWREKGQRGCKERGGPSGSGDRRDRGICVGSCGAFIPSMVFLSLLIPKEYGGMDTDITSFCIVVEEIATLCASSALLVIVQAVGTMPVVLGGTNELKERVLPRLAKEKGLICFCLTEPESVRMRLPSERKLSEGDHYVINGRKCFITNGGVADFYTVFATIQPGKKIEGITGFVLEKGTPGLSIGKTEEKMGIRGSNTTEVILEDVKVPVAQRIGDEGTGWWQMMRTLNRSRPAIGAQAVGLAQGA